MREEWKDIKGYEGHYQVSNLGRVKSLKYGKEKILKLGQDKDGYSSVVLSKKSKLSTKKVHRLVLGEFTPYSTLPVNHKDGNKRNNKLNNLEYCTHKENIRHAHINGLMSDRKGSKSAMAKLTESQVVEIRDMYNTKLYTLKQIAAKYNMGYTTIQGICSGKYWTHV